MADESRDPNEVFMTISRRFEDGATNWELLAATLPEYSEFVGRDMLVSVAAVVEEVHKPPTPTPLADLRGMLLTAVVMGLMVGRELGAVPD